VIFPYMTKHFFPVPEAFAIPASCEVRVNAASQKDAASGVQLSRRERQCSCIQCSAIL